MKATFLPAALAVSAAGLGVGVLAWLQLSSRGGANRRMSQKRSHRGLEFHERDLLEFAIAQGKLGDAPSVADAIDHFCYNFGWAMNVGDKKGAIVDEIIADKKPRLVLELGGYVGYSAIRFGHQQQLALQQDEASPSISPLYLSIEIDPLMAAISTKLVEHAGLDRSVKVLIGSLATTADRIKALVSKNLAASGSSSPDDAPHPFDLIFIDHWKEQYVPDLLLLEKLGFIGQGTVVIGDNIYYPGAPEYLKLMTEDKKGEYDSRLVESTLEYSDTKDALLISVKK